MRKTAPLRSHQGAKAPSARPPPLVVDKRRETRFPDTRCVNTPAQAPFFHCGIADPLGVCDVKDQFGHAAEATQPLPISRFSPGFPKPPDSIAQGVPTLPCGDVQRLWKTRMGSKFPTGFSIGY